MNKYFNVDLYEHTPEGRCIRWWLIPNKVNCVQGTFEFLYLEEEDWLSFEIAWNDFIPFVRFGKVEFLAQLPRFSDWAYFFKE